MALLPAPDGSNYCMDVRETTRAEYDAFLKAKAGDTSGQPPDCSWNTSFVPPLVSADAATYPDYWSCPDYVWNDMRPNQAVSCVDFCDAVAYCEWAGKRLCGLVGKGAERVHEFGGTMQQWSIFLQNVVTSTQSEFINACTQGGKTTYPYGDTYEPGVCIDATWVQQRGATAMDVTDTASRSCHGTIAPFDAVYDLLGSVVEWQNMCFKAGSGGSCIISGSGASSGWQGKESCRGYIQTNAVAHVDPAVGFRCCADPVH